MYGSIDRLTDEPKSGTGQMKAECQKCKDKAKFGFHSIVEINQETAEITSMTTMSCMTCGKNVILRANSFDWQIQ